MSEENTTAEMPTTEQIDNQPEQQGPDLTVQDLQALKNIIDVASSRGAFKPNEMMAVGSVYTKLETFLKAVTAPQSN